MISCPAVAVLLVLIVRLNGEVASSAQNDLEKSMYIKNI
jgi:hypothetical protein